MSSMLDVESPVTVSMCESGASVRRVIDKWLYSPPSICTSPTDPMPRLTPIRGKRRRCPSRPETGYSTFRE
jgi:hypothetical protein